MGKYKKGDLVFITNTHVIGQVTSVVSDSELSITSNKLNKPTIVKVDDVIKYNNEIILDYFEVGKYKKVNQVLALIDLNQPTRLKNVADVRAYDASFKVNERGEETDDIDSYLDDISSGFSLLEESPLGRFDNDDTNKFIDKSGELWYRVLTLDAVSALHSTNIIREIRETDTNPDGWVFGPPLLNLDEAIIAFSSGKSIFYDVCKVFNV